MSDHPLEETGQQPLVISLKGVYGRFEYGQGYGPIDLNLVKGEGALLLHHNVAVLMQAMRICLGFSRPSAGSVTWWENAFPGKNNIWHRYGFYHQIGVIGRASQLLRDATLLENLILTSLYARLDYKTSLKNAKNILDHLRLSNYEYAINADLPETKRRLALYALALVKKPRLLLMERPRQFLDHDFDLVWDFVLRASSQGLSYIVFDRSADVYEPDDFKYSMTLTDSYW